MTRPADPRSLSLTALALHNTGRPFAVVTVLKANGSTPVSSGTRAVVEADGTTHGTVGGGAVEAEARHRARLVARSGQAIVFDFDLAGPGAHAPDPICGGTMRLLVMPAAAAGEDDYRRAVDVLAQRGRGVWVTTFRQAGRLDARAQFLAETELASWTGFPERSALASSLAEEATALVAEPTAANLEPVEVFVEPLLPRPVLVIVGGGHVGQAVAAQADLLGFEITVIEDRPEFAAAARFPPGTVTRCGTIEHEIASIAIDRDTFVVVVTRGHQHDATALRACIRRPAGYLGMIGSRRKVPLLRRQFLENGWATPDEFDRVYAPVGLDLGAVTVPEIATSILAQMIAVRRRGSAPRISLP